MEMNRDMISYIVFIFIMLGLITQQFMINNIKTRLTKLEDYIYLKVPMSQ
jgi:hypothetical protein